MPSPLGEIALTSNGDALTGVYLPENSGYKAAKKLERSDKPFREVVKQLNEYFAGKRKEFDLPLASDGTKFQQKVWKGLQKIGYGKTKTYGELATTLGVGKAYRAVGSANGKNLHCIIVPCHRVVAANGGLGGYNGGLEAKKWLLAHEES